MQNKQYADRDYWEELTTNSKVVIGERWGRAPESAIEKAIGEHPRIGGEGPKRRPKVVVAAKRGCSVSKEEVEVPHLLLLLSGDYSLHVQRNACAALTAVMNASEMLYHSVAETPNLLKGLLRCLEPRVDDVGLRINALAALSALAQQELGLALIQDAGVEDTLLFLLTDTIDG
ncbi:hypothetical protein L7F22_042476 [Adiantum nelumboides]|nr:hypothetical protein [Adiantum nelumboides]